MISNIPVDRFCVTDKENAKIFYKNYGYVILKDFYSVKDLSEFKNEVVNIINAYLIKAKLPAITGSQDKVLTDGINQLEKLDHDYVAAVYDTIFQSPSFFRIIGNKSSENLIKFLLDLDMQKNSLYGHTNRCRIDPPRDNRRTYGWHQEVFYTIPEGNYIQTWAPLLFDTTIKNGTIEIAAGSHKEGIAKQSWNEVEGGATQIIVDPKIVDKYPNSPLEMKLGELLLFSGYLFHRSGNNISDHVRYSLVGMFHDVSYVPFTAPKLNFQYRGITPQNFYNKTFLK